MKVYNLTINGGVLSDSNIENMLDTIKNEFYELDSGDSSKLKIGMVEMTQEDYDNLPEFTGF